MSGLGEVKTASFTMHQLVPIVSDEWLNKYPKVGESFKITLYHTPNTGRLPTSQDSKLQDTMKGIYHETVYAQNLDAVIMELKHDTVNKNEELWKNNYTWSMPGFVQDLKNDIEVWSASHPLSAGQRMDLTITANNTGDTLSCRLHKVADGILFQKYLKVGMLELTLNNPPPQNKLKQSCAIL